MKSQSVQLGYALAAALVLCAVPGHAAGSHVPGQADVSGVVRDSQGVPQIGVVVELIRANAGMVGAAMADSSIVSRVFTDRHGHFSLLQVQPGTYSIEAVATAFLPALRQNVRIRSNTVVNLTLSTLFEAAQWLPAEKRPGNQPDDDWTWTLRSSVNRPLLRMLDSGPLVLVDGGAEASRAPATRVRLTASAGSGTFGEGNMRSVFEVQHSTDDSRQLIVRTKLSAGGTAAFESVGAYRHEMAPGHTMRTVLAVQDEPEVRGQSGVEGMQALLFRSSESLQLGSHLVADAGNEFQAIQLGRTNVASYPFAALTWTRGAGSQEVGSVDRQDTSRGAISISYRMATSPTAQRSELIDSDQSMAIPFSVANGISQVEHGLHQEISLEHRSQRLEVEIAAFHDHVINPVVSGGGTVKAGDAESGELLLDESSGLIRVAGQDYSGTGVMAEAKEQIAPDTWVTIECADGTALALGAVPGSSNMLAVLDALQLRNVQVYSIAMSGRVNRTGAHWRTSYRWQPSDTVTAVAPFDSSPEAAYLSIYLRQPIHISRMLPNGMDAVIDVRNLLAEGYRPFVTADGSTLYFAQADRSIQGGLSFSF